MRSTQSRAGGGRGRAALVRRARESIEKGSYSFSAASRLFDKDTRERSWLLYAWCRRCDDIADGQDHGGDLNLAKSGAVDRVEALRVLTGRALEGQPTADIAFDALGQVAAECGIREELTDDVIDGFALDANGWIPRTEEDLMRYCYHVAGAVGVMMARVMGVPADDTDTLDRACDLGFAFQLANIARDISEDDAVGRCYVPQQWLARADIEPGQHMKPHNRFKLSALSARMIDMMDEYLDAARLGAARLRFRQRWAVLSAARIYGAIGHKVRDRGQNAWNSRTRTNALEKGWHMLAALGEAIVNRPYRPEKMPEWSRGRVLIKIRMDGRVAPMPMTPLREDEAE
ncbi:phytoene/squalene synthase family protein [Paraurantiacibacter namhicola]|nr:phytoene/squalene synthase family protein [Paraurantiacibacter namhicola]